jgi:hypothetical protein
MAARSAALGWGQRIAAMSEASHPAKMPIYGQPTI